MQIPAVECGGKAGSGMLRVTTGVSLLPRGATCGTSIPEGFKGFFLADPGGKPIFHD